jgi:2-polyprenyl-6-hydroxyphenyl methylase/3-demethylubiquinone-9 3-methyltransferase
VDPAEVEKFSKMAAQWWDPAGNFKPLHELNPVRVRFIRDMVFEHYNLSAREGFRSASALSGLKILDIGCGGGLLTEPMTRLGAQVTGSDVSEKNIGTAAQHAAEQDLKIDYRVASAEELARQESEKYDVITSMEVIEHVADIDSFMEAASSLLKPGGIMLLATLNRTLKSYALAIIGAEYILNWLPRHTHDWNRFLTPKELAALVQRHGLKPGEAVGVTLNPLRGEWRVSRDVGVNYMLSATKG